MKINKKQLMPAIVLGVICIVVAGLLAVLNLVTRDRIDQNKWEKEQKAIAKVYEDGAPFTEVTDLSSKLGEAKKNGATSTEIQKVWYTEEGGYVFRVATVGYDDGLEIMIGITPEGKIAGITHVASSETNSAEGKLNNYYKDKGANDSALIVGGSTKTSDGYKNAVAQAFAAKAALDPLELWKDAEGGSDNG